MVSEMDQKKKKKEEEEEEEGVKVCLLLPPLLLLLILILILILGERPWPWFLSGSKWVWFSLILCVKMNKEIKLTPSQKAEI